MHTLSRFTRPVAVALSLGLTASVAFVTLTAQSTPPASAPAVGRALSISAVGSDVADWARQVTVLEQQGRLRLASSREDTMIAGRVHDRFDQYVGEVRVFGAQVVRQRSADGVLSVFGQLYPDSTSRPPFATLTPDEAAVKATTLLGRPPLEAHPPELVLLPRDDGSWRLTWYLRVFTGRDLVALFLDADSGDEVFRYSDLQTQSAVGAGTGVLGDRKKIATNLLGGAYFTEDKLRPPTLVSYDLKGDVARVERALFSNLPLGQSDIATDTDNVWTDGAVVDAHVYLGFTYDYYFKRFERRGLNGSNSAVRAIVHPARRQNLLQYDEDAVANYLLNAFWCSGCGADRQGFMVFGDGLPSGYYLTGSGQTRNYFSASLDVVAHELTHAVTSFTSDLIYRNESGALNEAFSDIMGVSVDFFVVAQGAKTTPANYVLGEEVALPFQPGSVAGIRSMSNPASFGHPDHYSRRYTGTEDGGGVHFNSGIVNHAFYLAIEGGTNRISGLGVTGVGGANREQIERIFYRAFTQFLPSSATFAIARQATLRAATDLYGGASPAYRAVEQAWTAVGVQ
jgi:bacillolysin